MLQRILICLFFFGMIQSPLKHCVCQTPGDKVINSICISTATEITGEYFSIAQMNLRSADTSFTLHKAHNEVGSGNSEKWDTTLLIKIFAIKTNTDRFLAGRVYIELYTPTPHSIWGKLQYLYFQMEDENGNAIGQFNTSEMLCKGGDIVESKLPTDYFVPCGQVGSAATKAPNAVLFAWYNRLRVPKMIDELKSFYGTSTQMAETSVVWGFSHTSCDKPKKIRLRSYIHTTVGHLGTHRTSWMEVNWVGASDILKPDEVATCRGELVYPSVGGSPLATWIKSVAPILPITEPATNMDIVRTKKICKPIRIPSATATTSVSSFGGRCKTHNEYETSNTRAHECEAGPNATKTENFTGYKDYMERRKNCMKINGCPCQCRDGSNFKNMTAGPQNSTCPTLSVVNFGVDTNSNVGKYILRSRKAHGMAMLIVTMVFVPFTILVSRYFKETWLSHAQLSNLQIWYLVHIGLTFLTVCLYIFGSVSLRRSKALVGDSLFGEKHRGLGWATITFFILTTFTGPIRPISNASQMTRKCVMIIHALLGIVYYCLGMAAVITSSYIPGSPSSSEVDCFTSPSYTEYSSSPTIPLVVTWIVMDFGFHVIFMLLLRWGDRSLNIRRRMYLPLISILKYEGHHDMKGFRYRKLMLIIYGICNFGIVLELIIRLANSTKAGCSFGLVSCTFASTGETAGNGSYCVSF